jgi:hypothetical protein
MLAYVDSAAPPTAYASTCLPLTENNNLAAILFLFACAEQLFEGTVSRDGG